MAAITIKYMNIWFRWRIHICCYEILYIVLSVLTIIEAPKLVLQIICLRSVMTMPHSDVHPMQPKSHYTKLPWAMQARWTWRSIVILCSKIWWGPPWRPPKWGFWRVVGLVSQKRDEYAHMKLQWFGNVGMISTCIIKSLVTLPGFKHLGQMCSSGVVTEIINKYLTSL